MPTRPTRSTRPEQRCQGVQGTPQVQPHHILCLYVRSHHEFFAQRGAWLGVAVAVGAGVGVFLFQRGGLLQTDFTNGFDDHLRRKINMRENTVSFRQVSGGTGDTRDGDNMAMQDEPVRHLTTTMSLIESAKGVVDKLFATNPHSAQMA